MSLSKKMRTYQVNVDEALERFMGNEKLYEATLKKFPAAAETHPVEEYIESGDNRTATANAHTLKGVTGNLSITVLYNAYTDIVRLLREGRDEKALAALRDILPYQESIIECIKEED